MPRHRKVCTHRWILGAPSPVTTGKCSLCGKKRTFDNRQIDQEFRTGVNVGKKNQIALRPFGSLESIGKVNDGYWTWAESKPLRRNL